MTSRAYAVALHGEVLPSTVFSHARGAMVNFLVQRNWVVARHTSDEKIREIFMEELRRAPESGAALVVVNITVAGLIDPSTAPLLRHPPKQPQTT